MRDLNFLRALTGQIGEEPKDGILMSLNELFIWIVLDHFRRTWAPGGAKNMSPWANCLRELKVDMECGTRLEILRKLKNDNKIAALHTKPMNIESHTTAISVNRGVSMIGLILTLRGADLAMALLK